jgi:predicted Zn-dependent protease
MLDKVNLRKTVRNAIKLAKASAKTRKQPIKLSEEKTVKTSWNVQQNIDIRNINIEEEN